MSGKRDWAIRPGCASSDVLFKPDFFDPLDRKRALAKIRRPLDRMNEVVDWEMFRPVWEEQLEYGKSPGRGRPAKDPLLMLKMRVLQDLLGLSDEETEFQGQGSGSWQAS